MCHDLLRLNLHVRSSADNGSPAAAIGVDGREIGSGSTQKTDDLSSAWGTADSPLDHVWTRDKNGNRTDKEYDFTGTATKTALGNEILGGGNGVTAYQPRLN